jgi:hypothetical protein
VGANILGFNGVVLSVVHDVPVNSKAPMVTLSISRICRLSLSEVLIGVGLCACIHGDECAYVFVSVCVCTVFLKKKLSCNLNVPQQNSGADCNGSGNPVT